MGSVLLSINTEKNLRFRRFQKNSETKLPIPRKLQHTPRTHPIEYLENKLLQISINFTPKTSHSCLKNGTPCFPGRYNTLFTHCELKAYILNSFLWFQQLFLAKCFMFLPGLETLCIFGLCLSQNLFSQEYALETISA